MPKWISVEEAAAKYGINKEVIWLWAEMKRFPMSYEKGITTVDEESLIGFLHQNKDRITAEYIDTLKNYVLKKQISVTYMLKLLAVRTRNSCVKGNKLSE